MIRTDTLVERLKAVSYLKVRPAPASDVVTVIASYFTQQDAALCAEAADALEAKDARIAELEADAESLQLAREIISDMARWGYLSADPDERGYFIGDDVLETIMRRAASARGRE